MNKRKIIPLFLALLAVMALTGVALAAGSAAVDWQAISGGGAPTTGGSVTLNDTLGQPLIGPSSAGNVTLGAGYWNGYDAGATAVDLYTFRARSGSSVGVWLLGAVVMVGVALVATFRISDRKPFHRGGIPGRE